jgi:hypothetical protein
LNAVERRQEAAQSASLHARIAALCAHELSKSRKLKSRTAAWYPKTALTFTDAIAAIRRKTWAHQNSFMSRPRRDSIEIPRHIWHRMENALAYAA